MRLGLGLGLRDCLPGVVASPRGYYRVRKGNTRRARLFRVYKMSAGYARGSTGNSHSRGGPLGLPTGRGSVSTPVGTWRGRPGSSLLCRVRALVFGDFAGWLGPNQGGDIFLVGYFLSPSFCFLSRFTGRCWYRRDCRVRKP